MRWKLRGMRKKIREGHTSEVSQSRLKLLEVQLRVKQNLLTIRMRQFKPVKKSDCVLSTSFQQHDEHKERGISWKPNKKKKKKNYRYSYPINPKTVATCAAGTWLQSIYLVLWLKLGQNCEGNVFK